MGFEVQEKVTVLNNGSQDSQIILSSSGGARAVISPLSATIEQLVFPINGRLVPMVFGHGDNIDAEKGLERQVHDYSADRHKAVVESMNVNLMAGGVPVTFFPGRLEGGQFWFKQSATEYLRFGVANSHPKFKSLLHFGQGRYVAYSVREAKPKDDSAFVRLSNDNVGECFHASKFPKSIGVIVEFSLNDASLERRIAIVNGSFGSIFMPTSDHGSYMPGFNVGAGNLNLRLDTDGYFALNDGTKIASGRYNSDFVLNGANVANFDSLPESLVKIKRGVSAEIMNSLEGVGLRIMSETSEAAYLWVPAHKRFGSVQLYNGGITAASSLPGNIDLADFKSLHPALLQADRDVIAPNDYRTYIQKFEPITAFSE